MVVRSLDFEKSLVSPVSVVDNLENSSSSLGSPSMGTCEEFFETYPVMYGVFERISRCGHGEFTFGNPDGDEIVLRSFCDNRVCTNPDCKKHRLNKYMSKHRPQIIDIGKDIRKPKAWIFTTPVKEYPIDRDYCRQEYRRLMEILNKKKHPKYGSVSKFSVHMEIKVKESTWFLHFHVVSGGIKNFSYVKNVVWGFYAHYDVAINPKDLAYYVSKYASKVPHFTTKQMLFEYAYAVYKLKMHGFSVRGFYSPSEWFMVDSPIKPRSMISFKELTEFFDNYCSDG